MKTSGPDVGGRPTEPLELIREAKLLLGRMIRERLNETGLKQSDLGRRLGVPPSQIAVWINQPTRLSLEAVVRLLWAMNARLHVHVEGHDGEHGPPLGHELTHVDRSGGEQ